jgi:hypothetical protein
MKYKLIIITGILLFLTACGHFNSYNLGFN